MHIIENNLEVVEYEKFIIANIYKDKGINTI